MRDFKHKTLLSKVHGGYKYRQKKIVVRESLLYWWQGRLIDGCQFSNRVECQQGQDYRGGGYWKQAVSVAALYQDYSKYAQMENLISPAAFIQRFTRMIGPVSVKTHYVKMTTPTGKILLRWRRRFVRFATLEEHQERMKIWLKKR